MDKTLWNRDFILLTLSNFLLCITYYALISTLPIYLAVNLHADNSAIGIVLAVYTIASVLVRPFSGFALDKFGRKMIFLAALILYTAVFVGYIVAISIAFITLLRFMQGLGWGVATISGATMAVDIMPANKRGEGIGFYSLSTTLGMSVGPIIGLFIARQWDYMAMFWGLLLISSLGALSGYLVKIPRNATPAIANLNLNLHNLFEPKALSSSFNLLIVMMAYGGLLSFVALYGREVGVQNTSLFFLIFAIGIAISRITVGKVFDKHGPARILTLCLILDIFGFAMLALLKTPMGYFASAMIIGFGNGVVFPVFQTMVNNLAEPSHRGAANSTLYTALDLGMGSGMVAVGIISEHTSLSISFLICALLCIAGLVLFRRYVLGYYLKHVRF
ncbi:MFS transporter [Microbacter margulisiae]|uniref:MFS family permease n=1 Tax=Microbacter margulisiae TaxID=1350067 RepID=A0A7W5H340_9PORP|nr:MFS transporter [Microbacter margulisiae]MBB3188420.1 MFS family permease [Microbacter margulisiae]